VSQVVRLQRVITTEHPLVEHFTQRQVQLSIKHQPTTTTNHNKETGGGA